ncbi:PilC/PilY family type IV pilus protein [Bowmanella pacifica]|uniref:PilY1 beta-propeller domain-containing protein n=2 Tax=Bowmanella TaxID=366580 RepID=A0A918DF62_9ALTE|nr:PilC/PilY family type IV pilus protein [Bowmanella pacifica]GGO63367.1 hypothetical protein GCM10010982_00240 [Bowmanella pacifica]
MNKLGLSVSSALLSAMISMSAFGDDLEIYLGTGNSQVNYHPNVLFIMDTSGSMTNKDGGDTSRMARVQQGLKTVLQSVTNINAGLMRFSDYGGPVLYPVRGVDEPVEPEFITSIAQPGDDAYERNGVVTLNSTTVKLAEGTDKLVTGLRFSGVSVPQGAVITSAFLRFTSAQLNTASVAINFQAELTANSTTFTSSPNDISSRPRTLASVDWTLDNDWPISGELVNTPDISPVIQEIVDLNGWCGGNSLSVLITGQGTGAASTRLIQGFEEGSGLSAQLVLAYDQASATGCVSGEQIYQVNSNADNVEERGDGYDATGTELTFDNDYNRYIGMRFENVTIPQGAVVQEAYLEFTGAQKRWDSASFKLSAANVDDAPDFNPHYRYMVRNMAKTSSVTWSNVPKWSKNQVYQSPSLASAVQQVVNRGGWQPGNAMVFIASDFDGERAAFSYKGKPSEAPRLIVKFQGNATPETASTVREHLLNKVDELSANGYTPIVDTLYEAVNYYGGLDVDYGLTRGNSNVSSSVRRSTRVSHRMSYAGADAVLPPGCSAEDPSNYDCITEYIPSGATYLTPITDMQCQTNNHIVLLSDGEANSNHSVNKIQSLLNQACAEGYSGGETCGIDLVKNISKSADSVIGTKIVTHTIGFAANATANNYLNQLAINGGGGFYTADSTENLVDAFQSILKTVKDVNATFVSPGVAVNQLNRLTHKDELYFALFKPAEGTIWPGNLKKYKISGDVILDSLGQDAVDDSTGFFHDNSHSYWSTLADGNDVREGGAASRMSLPRNVYFFSGNGTITTSANQLHENNNSILPADLGIPVSAQQDLLRDTVVKWTRGVDVQDVDADGDTTDIRLQMGDPIHSQPVIINYSNTDAAILVATNQGFLHSFDAETGAENFAVTPKELMSNLYDFYQDNSTFTHVYGLDGDLVLRQHDDGRKLLYVGMRRGGRNYYAFDVSTKTEPSLLFKIEGGSVGFEKLGQSWSRPTVTKVRIGGNSKTVLIFGGGYDAEQDNKALRSPDVVGNAVYMVDADTGALLWSASNAGADLNLDAMQYSIPARISVIDRENDGYADHMYVVDTGGQLFRLDIHNGQSGSDFVTGAHMASFSSDATVEDNRRFYYGPDVSEISLANEHYYAVALGSGYRAHPLNTQIQDNMYMIKDKGVFTLDIDGNYGLPEMPITTADLYDATDHLLTSSNQAERELEAAAFAGKQGWFIRLGGGGEKVLASPLILNYKLFFTTYLPASISQSLCAPPTGNSRAYLVELINGNAVKDFNNNGDKEHVDRHADLKQTGIAPDTKILIEDIVKPVVCLGTECTSAVIDENEPCGSAFECLAENIYGRFERVQRGYWKTEHEREQ